MTAQEIRDFSTEIRKRAQSPITGTQLAMEITLANVQAQLEIAAQLADLNEVLQTVLTHKPACSGIASDNQPCALPKHGPEVEHSVTGPYRNHRPSIGVRLTHLL